MWGRHKVEWVLDVTLIIMLASTLFHALRLERALGVLKRDRAALEDLVSSFNSSSRMAEQGIDRLRHAADGAGRQISQQTDFAIGLKNDLILLSERGGALADRLEMLIRSARSVEPFQRQDAVSPIMSHLNRRNIQPEEKGAVAITLNDQNEHVEHSEKLRSQAERDLLKALRTAR